jgi:hypothetical protein
MPPPVPLEHLWQMSNFLFVCVRRDEISWFSIYFHFTRASSSRTPLSNFPCPLHLCGIPTDEAEALIWPNGLFMFWSYNSLVPISNIPLCFVFQWEKVITSLSKWRMDWFIVIVSRGVKMSKQNILTTYFRTRLLDSFIVTFIMRTTCAIVVVTPSNHREENSKTSGQTRRQITWRKCRLRWRTRFALLE